MLDGQAPSPAMGSLRPSYDETPYSARAPPPPPSSSSSSMISSGTNVLGREREHPRDREREWTLKEDIEREREDIERERERAMQRRASSRSASGSGRASSLGPPPLSASGSTTSVGGVPGSARDRESEHERIRREDMDAIRAAAASRMPSELGQVQKRDARGEPSHHHHHHHHHHALPPHQQPLPHPHHALQQQHTHPHPHQLQQQAQAQAQAHTHTRPHTPHTLAQHGGPPSKANRGGVLKLAPPGVTVPSNPPPGSSSSDASPAGGSHPGGFVVRPETLALAPASHAHQQHVHSRTPSTGPQPIQPLPAHMLPPAPSSPSALSLRLAPDQQQYVGGPHGHVQQQQQHAQQASKHKSYSVVPMGPGGPPPSMMAAQQHHQQSQQQFGAMSGPSHPPPHPHLHHTHSLPPPPTSSASSSGMHTPVPAHPHHPHSNPYRHMSSSLPPPPQPYPPSMQMHYALHNEAPPPPIPMAFPPLPPQSPAPQKAAPAEAALHIGTFVFPRTPFPYFFSSRREAEARRAPASEDSGGQDQASKKAGAREPDALEGEREMHATILVPSAHLPSTLPLEGRPRIWGGALTSTSPAVAPPSSDPYAVYRHQIPQRGARRVYTDDSEVALCAFHAGRVSWAGMMRARAAGLDLQVRLALHRDVGRYVGGPNAFADGSALESEEEPDAGLRSLMREAPEPPEGTVDFDDASWLQQESASWESGHDGSGIEVLAAEWMPVRKLSPFFSSLTCRIS
ncbi:hypothetical protein DFH11DRAFT_1580179 [Phellopilus nigrolimitatus]|nr:hypothetical protein DFH11DRAFT_1580179 [Phellopilus nigrolimitatus]